MLITLDKQEADQYEVKSLWDVFPDANPQRPRVQPKGLEDNSALARVHQKGRGRPSAADVIACVSDEAKSVKQTASDLRISFSSASNLLWRLEREGRVRKILRPAGYRRHATVLYVKS